MKTIKNWRVACTTSACLLMLAACGGGGTDAGSAPFNQGAGTSGLGTTGSTTGTSTSTGTNASSGVSTSGPSTTTTTGPTVVGTATGTTTVTPGGGVSSVGTGIPNQKFFSMSVSTLNIDWGYDGETTDVNVFVADKAGNPVPDGTKIQFSTEGGQVVTSCTTAGISDGTSKISGCTVKFNTQDYRPVDGYVTVIAFTEGEEAFRDDNGNGVYDAGEPFIDSGRIFRDDDWSKTYETGNDELSVGSTLTGSPGIGTQACAAAPSTVKVNDQPLSVPNTCDGVWGKTLIRQSMYLPLSSSGSMGMSYDSARSVLTVFSGGGAYFNIPGASVRLPAPAGTKLTAQSLPTGCEVSFFPDTVGNAIAATSHDLLFKGCSAGSSFLIKASAPKGNAILISATVPGP